MDNGSNRKETIRDNPCRNGTAQNTFVPNWDLARRPVQAPDAPHLAEMWETVIPASKGRSGWVLGGRVASA